MTSNVLSHLQINVTADNIGFYRDLFTYLGWKPLFSDSWGEAFEGDGGLSLWFMTGANDASNDRDGIGVNHIAIGAESVADVDRTADWLRVRGVPCLFETPRHRPDFSHDEASTYYQVMFESPDGILFEHVYIGPKEHEGR